MTPTKIFRQKDAREYWFQEGCHILEIANAPADPDVSIARARVEPGQTTEWHRLSGVTERYLLIAGKGVVEVGTDEPQTVVAGDAVLIPADSWQRIRNTGDNDLVFYAICSPRFTPGCYRSRNEVDC